MSTGRPTPEHIRQQAIDDYHATRDTYAAVAARHGISRSVLHAWVNPAGPKRKYQSWGDAEVAYLGASEFDPSAWVKRRGILYPLYPARRSA